LSIGWDEAEPAPLPPPGAAERLRLWLRAAWAATSLATLFAVFLLLAGTDALLARLRGRRVSRLAPPIVRLWAAVALATLGLRYVQHGTPMRGRGAFVANHASWIDIIVLQRACVPYLVSKSEVRDWPVIGQIGRAIGTLFINRKAASARRQHSDLLDRLSRGDRMALFPEGTSTDGQQVLPFKSSLFGVFLEPSLIGDVAIQPVAISYRPPAQLPDSFYGWWGDRDFADHLREVLARSVGGTVEISFLEPVAASSHPGRKEMALACGSRVAAEFARLRQADGRSPLEPISRQDGR
jgi:lyso-ornithine lipid O-acyltransferase